YSAHSPSPSQSQQIIDTLDHVIQQRFHNVIGFGMARIVTERKFAPENEEEKKAVRELRKAGLKVGLYLAGRGILEPVPEEHRVSKRTFGSVFPGQPLSGPIFVSSTDSKDLPTAKALWEPTRQAMLAFTGGSERYSFSVGEWAVEARPVRASDQSCIKCHSTDMRTELVDLGGGRTAFKTGPKGNTLQVGDPLGVLLYAYRQRR
ncbi:MAG: hypothetical protein M3371_07865, partial [Acidobacteriota bacterium]|nr:hypothetical protein [Acidobacteriota bacterium]